MFNSNQNFNYKIVYSTKDVNLKDWNSLPKDNIFLELDYLEILEETVSEIHQFIYVLYYDKFKSPIGKSIFQVLEYDAKTFNYDSVPCRFQNKILNFILIKKLSVLIAGNIFATGDNAFCFQKRILDNLIYKNINSVINFLLQKNKNLNYIVFKEFFPDNKSVESILKRQQFLRFNIDVNMVLDLKSYWNDFDDIMQDYRTKYRSRFNKAFLKSNDLVVKDFNVSDIKNHSDRFQNLYNQVLKNSNFNLGIFNIDTFIRLKEKLVDRYIVSAYFIDENLIGFRSSFVNNNNIETSFVGIDYEHSLKYNLYPKMLKDFINYGIKKNASSIGFGRTAETMKSAFGAKPLNMNLFIRSRTKVGKILLRLIIQNIKPTEFKLRKPFKKEFYTESDMQINNTLKIDDENDNFVDFIHCPFNRNKHSNM